MAVVNIYFKNKMSSTTNTNEVKNAIDLQFSAEGVGGGTTKTDSNK